MQSFPIDNEVGPQVIQELIYRLKVRDVMTQFEVSGQLFTKLRA
jgi:hypothetical protein